MESMDSERIQTGDEKNTTFGFPKKVLDQKSGFDREAAKKWVETGKDLRRRPREEKEIPQESLAVRIANIQKRDDSHGPI